MAASDYVGSLGGSDFFPCLAGDPDIAGACELCLWSVSVVCAVD